jgi:hypothetical protein
MSRKPKPAGPEGTVWFGGDIERACLWLRFTGEDLEPEEITNLLGNPPSHSRRKGEVFVRKPGAAPRTARIGSWILEIDLPYEMTVDEGIPALFAQLTNDLSVWQSLTEKYKAELVCDAAVRGANQGFELPAEVVKLIAARNLTFGVDIFPQRDDEQAHALNQIIDRD